MLQIWPPMIVEVYRDVCDMISLPYPFGQLLFCGNGCFLVTLNHSYSVGLQLFSKTVSARICAAANVYNTIDVTIYRIGEHLIVIFRPGDEVVIKWTA